MFVTSAKVSVEVVEFRFHIDPLVQSQHPLLLLTDDELFSQTRNQSELNEYKKKYFSMKICNNSNNSAVKSTYFVPYSFLDERINHTILESVHLSSSLQLHILPGIRFSPHNSQIQFHHHPSFYMQPV